MHRFFLPFEVLDADTVNLTTPEVLHKLTKVLRTKPGDQILLLDGSGFEFVVELTDFAKTEIHGKIITKQKNQAEPATKITLHQALPKKPTLFEEILQHGTEIGIIRFVPLLTERTEVQSLRNVERLKKILREAAEQSGRGIIPELADPMRLTELWKNPPAGMNLIADSYTKKPLLAELLPDIKKESVLNIFIGPEGGFSEREIEQAKSSGMSNFSLGRRILRTETASVAVASTILFS